MRAATLFSGIGAPEQAMPSWDWLWHAEVEAFPNAVMGSRHPRSPNLGDVTADDFAERATKVGQPDVLVFGSPCQSFSVAGRRRGLDDPRGDLALVALGIVGRLRPRWFVFENVPGLLSIDDGTGFGVLLRAVDELGYSACWSVLDAQHFGVAQRRQRVFLVGHIGDWRGPAAVLLEPESLCGHSAPSRETGEGIAAPTAGSLNTSIARGTGQGHESDFLIAGFNNTGQGWWNEAIRKGDDGGGGGARESTLDFESETLLVGPLAFDCKAGGNTGFAVGDKMTSLRGEGHGGGHAAVAFSCKDHGADSGEVAPTLRAMPHDGSHANAGGQAAVAYSIMPQNSRRDYYKARPVDVAQPVMGNGPVGGNQGGDYIVQSAVRRLTPRECERLQGFPDDYTAVTYRGKPAADGPRYKALGNSMAVPCVRWILSRIGHVDGLLR